MIDALFTVINFLVFAGLVGYFFKTRLIPMLKAQIAEQRKGREDLVNKTIAASAEYRSLQEQMTEQDDLYTSLDKKIERWRNKLSQNNNAFLEQQKQQANSMRINVEKQMAFLNAFRTTKVIMPILIKDVRIELQEHFAQTKNIQEFDQKTINSLAGNQLKGQAS